MKINSFSVVKPRISILIVIDFFLSLVGIISLHAEILINDVVEWTASVRYIFNE